jgi:hypothetical protein
VGVGPAGFADAGVPGAGGAGLAVGATGRLTGTPLTSAGAAGRAAGEGAAP